MQPPPYNLERALERDREVDMVFGPGFEDALLSGTSSEASEDSDWEEEHNVQQPERWITHYSSLHRILLVGEGDFSFSACLARAFGLACNMIATSLDSLERVSEKYNNAIRNVEVLEEKGCLLLFGVDATKMSEHFFLRTQRFDRIVYNFPHVGFLYREASHCQIQLNKKLIKGFLKNAKVLLRKWNGEIHITHKNGDPYDKWDLERIAEKLGFVLLEKMEFLKDEYPGYSNKRAHGRNSDDAFYLGECTTFKFKLAGPLTLPSSLVK